MVCLFWFVFTFFWSPLCSFYFENCSLEQFYISFSVFSFSNILTKGVPLTRFLEDLNKRCTWQSNILAVFTVYLKTNKQTKPTTNNIHLEWDLTWIIGIWQGWWCFWITTKFLITNNFWCIFRFSDFLHLLIAP